MTTARTFLVQVFSWTLMFSVIAAGVALIVVPKAVGGRPLTVLSGSMVPAFDPGDVVVIRPVDVDELMIGDVITFQEKSGDPELISHRIIGISFASEGREFLTRGDANGSADLAPVSEAQVRGEVWYSVPLVGYVATSMAGGWMRTATDVIAVGLLLYGAIAIATAVVSRRRRRDDDPIDDPIDDHTAREPEEVTA